MRCIAVMAILAVLASAALADDTLWTRTFKGESAAMDRGKSVATIGNEIFVTGMEQGLTANVLLIRYKANGDTAWARAYDLDTMEVASDVAVGSDTSPVVCAQVQGATPKLLLVKYNKNGDTAWTRHRVGMNPISVAVDDQNAVYVWGGMYGTAQDESLGLFKYASDGTPVWEKTLAWGNMNRCAGLAATASGVVALANCNDSVGGHHWMIKFNSSGDTVWRQALDTLGGDAQSVVCDPSGTIYVGASRGSQVGVARCSTSGRAEWIRNVDVQPGPEAQNLIAFDSDDRVVVAGTVQGQRLAVVKLTETGDIYSTNYGPESLAIMVFGVAADAGGHPVVTGVTQTPPPACITIKFSGTVGVEEGLARPNAARPAGARIARAGTPVTVSVRSTGAYTVALFDARGTLVQQVHDGFLGAGDHRFTVSAPAAGSYYLRVTGAGSVAETKLVQVK